MAAAEKKKRASTKTKKKGGLKLKLVRSVIGTTRYQREVVRGLGLRRINHIVERTDTPELRGMILKVAHLIQVVEA
jgi:large subunit ribosomal protein L30